jgi:cytochrome c oxidase subunit 4
MTYPGTQSSPEEELEHHPSPRQYVRIGVILGVVTAAEVWIYYVEQLRTYLVPFLIAFSAVKFFLVVTWFMHLRFDSPMFRRLFLIGLVLALSVFLVVLSIFFGAGGGPAPVVTNGG